MARQVNQRWLKDWKMSSPEDKALCKLLDRMIPSLKKAILRDSEKRPDVLSLEIVLLASILQIRNDLGCN